MQDIDYDTEDGGEKVPGQKKARRLNKEFTKLDACKRVDFAKVASHVAKFQERANIYLRSIEVEELRAKVDLERAEVARDVVDNRVMAMG